MVGKTRWLATLGWLLAAVWCTAQAERPNILLILSDDHSIPHAGAYGGENCRRLNLTPNIDALAAAGMRFDRAYTTAPQCAPSRISIFSGQTPVRTSTTRFAQPARPGTVMFTDLLRQSGYWVGVDGRNQHLEGRNKEDPHVEKLLVELGVRGPAFHERFDHFVAGANTKNEALENVPEMISSALDEVPSGTPFFLYFGFNQTHRGWGNDHDGIDPAGLILPPDWPDLPGVREDYACFLADLRDLDRGMGMVMQVLEDRGIADNTMLVFMGDNGDSLLRGKGTLFDRGLHVPLIIRWPARVPPGSVSDALVSGIDLAPTFLGAAGLEPGGDMRGLSFLPALLGKPFTGQDFIFGERGWHFGPITSTNGFDLSRTIISRKYHLIYNVLPERMYAPVDMNRNVAWDGIRKAHAAGKLTELHERLYFQNPRPIFELYDIETDPFMLNNLSGQKEFEQIEEQLRHELDKWMVREGDYLPLATHAYQNMQK